MNTLILMLLIGLPHGMQSADNTDSMNVIVSGFGEPVVLIPGLMGSAFGFRKLVPLLDRAGYRSIVIEPLGFGSSARPVGADYSLTAQADRIAAALDTLVDAPVWLLAHSVGASIAYRLAFRHPNHVRGILSLEGGPTESITTPGFQFAMKFAPVIRMLGPGAIVEIIRKQMIRASADEGWITEDVIMGYTHGVRRDFDSSLKALRAMAHVQEPERLMDRLVEISCPVVVLVGAVSHHSGPREDDLALLGERVPNLTIDSIPGAGHFLHEENPEAVVEAIENLARRTVASAGRPVS